MELTSSSREDCVFAYQGRYLDGVCAKWKMVPILNSFEKGSFMKIFKIFKPFCTSLVFHVKVTNEEK